MKRIKLQNYKRQGGQKVMDTVNHVKDSVNKEHSSKLTRVLTVGAALGAVALVTGYYGFNNRALLRDFALAATAGLMAKLTQAGIQIPKMARA